MHVQPSSSQDPLAPFVRATVSNGHPREHAMIRKWWHEEHRARGLLIWEYHLEGRYLDAIWFPDEEASGVEEGGPAVAKRFPLDGRRVVLCEAKLQLSPELVGQALVYRQFALRAGALVQDVYIFSEFADAAMLRAAPELGLKTVVLKRIGAGVGEVRSEKGEGRGAGAGEVA